MLSRRTFVAGAAAGLVAASSARAQQQRLRRIAVVATGIPVSQLGETGEARFVILFRELRRLGYIDGQTIAIERYSTVDRPDTEFGELAQRVVGDRPDLIFSTGARLGLALKNATATIPIVFYAASPVEFGLVASLSRPGGNVTGFASDTGPELGGKRISLLQELVPSITRLAYLATSQVLQAPTGVLVRDAAKKLKLDFVPLAFDSGVTETSIQRAFVNITGQGGLALYVASAAEFVPRARSIAALALAARIPGVAVQRAHTDAGLLMSYDADNVAQMRGAAGYIDRILKGAKPADLPVQQPREFEFVINKKTADALGLEIPLGLWVQATEIIE